ncbi:MAG: PIN domain-containing protein [Deltaproteobacteria bacterium]|nr:PIN domain-containing protein [Deltaproteobacteria bacterium]
MSLLVDTNILVYAANEKSDRHRAAKDFVERTRASDGFCITWSILYEWLRIVTHPRVFEAPLQPEQARSFIRKVTADPRIDVLVETAQHERFLHQVLEEAPALRGNLYHDAHIAAVMREHGLVDIATADRHFRLFPSLRIVDPTA